MQTNLLKHFTRAHKLEVKVHEALKADRIRSIAKIFIPIKEFDSRITELQEAFQSSKYPLFVKPIKIAVGFSDVKFMAPSSASSYCTLIGHVSHCLKVQALMSRNEIDQKNIVNYLYLLEEKHNFDITKTANENRTAFQSFNSNTLPRTSEIMNVLISVEKKISHQFSKISQQFDEKIYHELTQVLLVYVMVFNRKRPEFKPNNLRQHLATCTSTLPYDTQRVVSVFTGHGMEIHNNIYGQRQVENRLCRHGTNSHDSKWFRGWCVLGSSHTGRFSEANIPRISRALFGIRTTGKN
ncbi:hypothetical protein HHI36_014788 [Cryptolaemus montrouzieri]|uniref:Uncharacterized protein n=1 Tax=Cryptolaemus montrouzieri TaxID=559131 RepID=A0ABD2N3Y6_9CUCU